MCDLGDAVANCPGKVLSIEDATWVLQELAKGLSLLHGKGILHADLKPGNVILSAGTAPGFGARLLLADFGHARRGLYGKRSAIFRGGTEGYVGPEEFLCLKSDIWSLGALVVMSITGHTPNALGFTALHDTFQREFLLVLGMLQDEPEARPSCTEVLRDIGAARAASLGFQARVSSMGTVNGNGGGNGFAAEEFLANEQVPRTDDMFD